MAASGKHIPGRIMLRAVTSPLGFNMKHQYLEVLHLLLQVFVITSSREMSALGTKKTRLWGQQESLCSKQHFQLEGKSSHKAQPVKLSGCAVPVKMTLHSQASRGPFARWTRKTQAIITQIVLYLWHSIFNI